MRRSERDITHSAQRRQHSARGVALLRGEAAVRVDDEGEPQPGGRVGRQVGLVPLPQRRHDAHVDRIR